MSAPEETKTTFRLPKVLLKEVKRYAIDHDTNATEIVKDALRVYLERHRKGKNQEV